MKQMKLYPRVCKERECLTPADGEICMDLYASIHADPFRNHPFTIHSGVLVCFYHAAKYRGDMLLSDGMKREIVDRLANQGCAAPDFKRTVLKLAPIV